MPELTAQDILRLVGPAPLMLEIGCNDGTDTQHFLDAMPGIRLFCFEPDPRPIARFKNRIHDSRVTLIEAAVSDTDSTAVFRGSSGKFPPASMPPNKPDCCFLDEWDLSGSLLPPLVHLSYAPWVTFPEDRQYTVATIRLDTWLIQYPEITRIDFIWADVQGAEELLIRGASQTLRRTRYLYTEFYNRPLYVGQIPLTEISRLLPDFEQLGIYGDNALFHNRRL